MRPYYPGGILNALAYATPLKEAASIQSLRLGLPGSLIPFATLAFVPERQEYPSDLLSPLAFYSISTDFTPPPSILITPDILKITSIKPMPEVEPQLLRPDLIIRLRNPLRPVNPDNARLPRIAEASGT